jgi:hypothetical protein
MFALLHSLRMFGLLQVVRAGLKRRPWSSAINSADHRSRPREYASLAYCAANSNRETGRLETSPMDDVTIARAIHVVFVVLWIGGVGFVTTVLLPAIRSLRAPGERMAFSMQLNGGSLGRHASRQPWWA